MKCGIVLFNKGPLASGENMARMAQRAEPLGFDHVVVTEHLVVPKREGEQDEYRCTKPSQQALQQEQRKGWEATAHGAGCLHRLAYRPELPRS